jgi:hypothetical protein
MLHIYIMDKIYIKIIKRHNKTEIAMPLTVSRQSHSVDPSAITGPVDVRYVVHTAALGRVFLHVLQFLLAIIVLPTLHTHLHLHVVLTTDRRAMVFQKWPSIEQKLTFIFFL